MQCDNCGKILDQTNEKQFCTGCGAPVVAKKEHEGRRSARERAVNPNKLVALKSIEVEIRARALYVGAFFGFAAVVLLMTISGSSQLIAFPVALICAPVGGIIMMTVIAKAAPSMKSSFNDTVSVLPVSARMRGIVESISSALPFIGPLPRE